MCDDDGDTVAAANDVDEAATATTIAINGIMYSGRLPQQREVEGKKAFIG